MMRTSIFLFVVISFVIIGNIAHSSELKYKVSDIQEKLKKNTRSVIRKDVRFFEIISVHEARQTVEFAITVMNQNGQKDALFTQFYDKFIKVKNIKATLYNAEGKEIKHFNAGEILDLSARAGYSIYEDSRVKLIDPSCRTFPFTFEYSYELEFIGILNYPSWQVYKDYNISVEKSSITVTCPKQMKFRFYERNMPIKSEIKETTGFFIYHWELVNMPALKEEPMSDYFNDYNPSVLFAPSNFEIGGSKGNSETWQNLGIWINELNEKRDILVPETVQKLKQLTMDAKDDVEKIEILYKYMQDRTRYVNITIGLGGWQPFDAATVDRLSYGDCKALTNYMKSILAVVGIKSYYTLAMAGERAEPIQLQFPSSQFNHVILCVPIKKDTIWLECTSQHTPCGYLGTFTDDRDVLLTDGSGGHIIHTKCYAQNENLMVRKATVKINDEGQGKCETNTLYTGEYFDKLYKVLYSDDQNKQNLISNGIDIPSFKLIKYLQHVDRERIPKIHENLNLELPNYASKISDKMLVPMNLMDKLDELPMQIGERKSEVLIRRAFEEKDSIIFTLPYGYKAEKIPDPVGISTIFGEYNYSIRLLSDDCVLYVRNFKLNKGKYAPVFFEKLKTFYEQVSNSDHNLKLALKKVII